MFFKIDTSKGGLQLCRFRAVTTARRTVLLYKMGSAEKELHKYLSEHYGIGLKPLCLKLLQNIRVSTDTENTVIITFKNKKYDEIAELITNGNSEVHGSDILQVAFGNKTIVQ